MRVRHLFKLGFTVLVLTVLLAPPLSAFTPGAEKHALITPTAMVTPTISHNATPTATPRFSPAPDDPTATADPSENLLTNPDFADGFNGWNMTHGHWLHHGPLCHPGSPPAFAEMDRDRRGGWDVGQEDWLWQDVTALGPHTQVVLSLAEAHHMHSGQAEIRIYGSADGATWEPIFFRPEVQASFGFGHRRTPVETFQHVIPANYPYYRLEIYGRMNEQGDGWLIGKLSLQVN